MIQIKIVIDAICNQITEMWFWLYEHDLVVELLNSYQPRLKEIGVVLTKAQGWYYKLVFKDLSNIREELDFFIDDLYGVVCDLELIGDISAESVILTVPKSPYSLSLLKELEDSGGYLPFYVTKSENFANARASEIETVFAITKAILSNRLGTIKSPQYQAQINAELSPVIAASIEPAKPIAQIGLKVDIVESYPHISSETIFNYINFIKNELLEPFAIQFPYTYEIEPKLPVVRISLRNQESQIIISYYIQVNETEVVLRSNQADDEQANLITSRLQRILSKKSLQ